MNVKKVHNNHDVCNECGDSAYVKINIFSEEICLCQRHALTLKSKLFYLEEMEKDAQKRKAKPDK